MRPTRLLVVIFLAVLISGLSNAPVTNVYAQSPTTSIVSIYTTSTCCQYLNGLFSFNVLLTLAPGISISGFDVIINYSNPYTSSNPGSVLHAESLNYAQNIFDPYSNTQVLFNCLDGVPQGSSNVCTDAPKVGQIEFTESLVGASIGIGGRLFSVAFQVSGTGTSIFTIVRANVVNPYGDPSNPKTIDPVFIPVITQDGIFGNTNGAIPFFTYQPADTSQSPAVLPNRQVNFNATSSFAGYNLTIGFSQYNWYFGDRTANATGATPNHTFALPGNYTVTLTAVDSNGEKGTISRIVNVHYALGSISLTVRNQMGSAIQANVVVKAFNSTGSTQPFATLIVPANGNVQFNNLTPSDSYYLSFIGQGFVNQTKTYSVKPGFTTMDTVYLSPTPAPPDYSGLIYILSFVGALGAVTAAIIYSQRKNKASARRATRPVTSRQAKKPDSRQSPTR